MSFPHLGVIGAGQLARMMVAPATELGVNLFLYAADSQDSAAQIVNHHVGSPSETEKVLEFAKHCDVVTFEHEQVPQSVIKALENAGVKVYPRSETFIFSQNKFEMRKKMDSLGLPNPRWEFFNGGSISLPFPLIAKTVTGGYDGRGVFVIQSKEELDFLHLEIDAPLLIEEKLDFDEELAIMVARNPRGEVAVWATTTTVQENGICTLTITPAPEVLSTVVDEAARIARTIAEGVNLVGVMAVELFRIENRLVINELAMRPHNSGHWSIEGSVTSQFEQHIRAVLNLPLGSTELTSPWVVMGNILGGNKADLFHSYDHLMARNPGMKFHHYKKEVRPGRKVGHVTVLGENLLELRQAIEHPRHYMSGEIDE